MANIDHLVGKKVIGNYGAMHPIDYGKITSVELGWILIEWNDKRTHMIHMLEFNNFQKSKNELNKSAFYSPIGIFLDESEAA